MELSITSCEYTIKDRRPEIHIWGRDKDKIRHEITDSTHHPYFFIRDKDYLKLPTLYSIRGRVKGYTHLQTGEKLSKYYVTRPSEVKLCRSILEKYNIETFESDILYPDVYLKDNNIYGALSKNKSLVKPSSLYIPPRLLYLDIEVYSKDINIMPRAIRDPILVIGLKDSYNPDNIIQISNKSPTSLKREKEMLKEFIKTLQEIDPDIIVGHFITGFDLPYLFDRMYVLKVKPRELSPMRVVRIRNNEPEIKGREIFDTIKAYRLYSLKELEEEAPRALDKICQKELNKKQIKFDEPMGVVWDTDYKKVLERNKTDLELTSELNEQLGLFRFFDELRRSIGCRFRDIFKKGKINDAILLRHSRRRGFVLSNRRKGEKLADYIGAYVGEPTPGIYNRVVIVDFRSFYPALIIRYNISPETWSPTYGDIRIDEEHAFFSTPKGILPESLQLLLQERSKIKKKINTTEGTEKDVLVKKSEALKSNVNSLYGNVGMPTSRIYHPQVAESITLIARKHIFKLNEMLSKTYGYNVFYNDTDSCYFILPKDITKEMLEKQIEDINSNLAKGLEIELQRIFPKFLILKKKRYAGIDQEGKLLIKGMEAIRTDTPELFAELQRWTIESILNETPRETIVSKIKQTIQDIRAERIPWIRLGVPKGVTKNIAEYKGVKKKKGIPAHIQAVLTSKDLLGVKFGKGSKPRILPLIHSKKIKYPKWIAISEDTNLRKISGKIDKEAIIKGLKSCLHKLIILYGINWDEVVPEEQKTLEGFK